MIDEQTTILFGIKVGEVVVDCVEVPLNVESVDTIIDILMEWRRDNEKGSFLMPTLQLQ